MRAYVYATAADGTLEVPLRKVPRCEMEGSTRGRCPAQATVYGGFRDAGGWAGYVCGEHAKQSGFQVWDQVRA